MQLLINGEPRQFEAPLTIATLLDHLSLKQDRVAVEHNRKLSARTDWPTTPLSEGDTLEIVQFVGGG